MWYWRYELRPRRRLSALAGTAPRHGALIRVGDGFADVHPWPELGDLPLDAQLESLTRGGTTPLTSKSLQFAAADGDARRAGRSLFAGLTIPESHWPADAGPAPDGFDTVKVKMWRGKRIDPGLSGYRLRLDYNATLTAAEFLAEDIPVEAIDFVEDPCPYDAAAWRRIREAKRVRLARDRGRGEEEGVDVLVVKPAMQEFPAGGMEVVVTSYMDHPLGQLAAAWTAALHVPGARCGLLTHLLYEADPFIERLRVEGARLVPPAGTGFGFDDLLERLPWEPLR